MPEFTFSTTRNEEILDITIEVNNIIKASKIERGICLVYTPHATAAIIVNENWDPNVCDDILASLSRMVPKRANYKHDKVDQNAAAHIKSAVLGPSEALTFKDGKAVLGRWQAIMYCEFDGPRSNRRVIVELVSK